MTALSMATALRTRMARLRRESDEDGFALIYVMLIATLVTITVTAVLVGVAGSVVPAKKSQDTHAATADAQAGVQRYLSLLNTACTQFSPVSCASVVNNTTITGAVSGTNGSTTDAYKVTVLNPNHYLSDGFLRLQAQGTSNGVTKTIYADIAGLPSILRYAYMSKYETLSSSFLDSYYGARNIKIASALDAGAATSTGSNPLAAGDTVKWLAPSSDPQLPDSICNQEWYDYNGAGRSTLKASEANLVAGYDWGEYGTKNSVPGNNYTMLAPCEVTFSTGQTFNGPVYSRDALYLSNGYFGGAGPTFNVPANEKLPAVSTYWQATDNPSNTSPFYRTFPIVFGRPNNGGTVAISPYDLGLPSTPTPGATTPPCIYYGPTRVYFSGANAIITSPETTSIPTGADPNCYPSPASMTSGILQFTLTNAATHGGGVIWVRNKTTATDPTPTYPTTGQKSTSNPGAGDTVFYYPNSGASVQNTPDADTATAPDSCSPSSTFGSANCAWSDAVSNTQGSGYVTDGTGWTSYSTGSSCPGEGSNSDRLRFECDAGSISGTHDAYKTFRQLVQAKLAAGTYTVPGTSNCSESSGTKINLTTASAADLTCMLEDLIMPDNTGGGLLVNLLNHLLGSGHAYSVSAGTPVTLATRTQTINGSNNGTSPISSDPLFTNAGTPATETVNGTATTFTFTRNDWICVLLCGTGSSPTFQVTITQTHYTANTSGVSGATYFPNMNDITQYKTADASGNGPGDAYIEGTTSGVQSVVADDDVVVTGPLKTTGTPTTNQFGEPSWATGNGAFSLVAGNNVRAYHPVSCADETAADINATSPGVCPNDITGLYLGNGLESAGALQSTHPAYQYCNMLTSTAANALNSNCSGNTGAAYQTGTGPVSQIDAAIFALNGSLMADNFNRAQSVGSLTVNGGIYQNHHGALGEEWEAPTTDTIAPPSSGYLLQDNYRDYSAANLPYVPASTTSSNGRAWNIVSESSGSA